MYRMVVRDLGYWFIYYDISAHFIGLMSTVFQCGLIRSIHRLSGGNKAVLLHTNDHVNNCSRVRYIYYIQCNDGE